MAVRSPSEAHSYWGAYSATALLPNVLASPTQSRTLQVGDTAYVTTDQRAYVCTNATPGAAVWARIGLGGSNEALFFEWNGADATQFNTTPVYTSAGITASSLSVVADAALPRGNKLRVSATKGASAATEYVVWFANDPLPSCEALINLGVRYGNLKWNFGISGGGSRYVGIATHGYDLGAGSALCVGHTWRMDGDNTWAFRLDGAGGPTDAGAVRSDFARFLTPNSRSQAVLTADNWEGLVNPTGVNVPRYRLAWWGMSSAGSGAEWRQSDIAGWTSPTEWENVGPIDRWGLCVQIPGSLAAGTTAFVDLTDLRLWTW